MKRMKISVIIACMLFTLGACSGENDISNASEEQISGGETGAAIGDTADIADGAKDTDAVSDDVYEEVAEKVGETSAMQLRIMAEHNDKWKLTDYAPVVGNYAVYDLDGDGRLELIANAVQGTGMYSDNHFYQLNVENTDMIELGRSAIDERGIEFDLGPIGSGTRAYMDEKGTYYYIAGDYTKSGIWQSACDEGCFYLMDGTVHQVVIRARLNELQEDDTYKSTYYEPENWEEISQEEWEDLLRVFSEDKREIEVHMEWKSLYEEEAEAMSADDWFALLADSYSRAGKNDTKEEVIP